jgi:hypothetical protein
MTTQTQNKGTQTSMPRVGFEPTIPVFEGAKTVHALDRAVTVFGISEYTYSKFIPVNFADLISIDFQYTCCRHNPTFGNVRNRVSDYWTSGYQFPKCK